MIRKDELPEGWVVKKLGEVATLNPAIPNKQNIDTEINVQFIPMKLVAEVTGVVQLTELRKYAEVNKGYTPFINGDVIFAKVTPCMENGKIAIVNNLANGLGFGSSEFHVFRTHDCLSNKFLFHFLVQTKFRKEAEGNMTGAVGLKRVPKQFLENYKIPLPPLATQQRIVAKIEELFSQLDNGIAQLKTAQAQLKVYRQAVLKWAFEGRLTNKDVKEGELPEGWEWVKIGEVADINPKIPDKDR
ncbi:MAG: restriction endonuclease subunit S, partial [Anaerolineales bacterium]|nr:restriction endonuclease subunit S [Anaerolineales bacterium]